MVGNSGSGKDSIISTAMEQYSSNNNPIYVAKRYITRKSSEFEDNYGITPEEFKEMNALGNFALKWIIYGLQYGVPIEIDLWLSKGHSVIVNVSRMIIKEAREQYKNLKVIFIEVPFEVTLNRIKERGRESGKILQERINRAKSHQKFPDADLVVDNSGKLENAVSQFLDYIIKSTE